MPREGHDKDVERNVMKWRMVRSLVTKDHANAWAHFQTFYIGKTSRGKLLPLARVLVQINQNLGRSPHTTEPRPQVSVGHVAHVAGASCVLGVLAEEFPLKSGVIVNLQENPREVFLLQRDDQHPATIGLLGCCIVDSGGLAKVAASCHQTFESKIDVATSPVVFFWVRKSLSLVKDYNLYARNTGCLRYGFLPFILISLNKDSFPTVQPIMNSG